MCAQSVPLIFPIPLVYKVPCCKDWFPLQVRLSIQSGLGLSLQAGPSVTRSLGSDVARIGDIQDEIQTKGTKFPWERTIYKKGSHVTGGCAPGPNFGKGLCAVVGHLCAVAVHRSWQHPPCKIVVGSLSWTPLTPRSCSNKWYAQKCVMVT